MKKTGSAKNIAEYADQPDGRNEKMYLKEKINSWSPKKYLLGELRDICTFTKHSTPENCRTANCTFDHCHYISFPSPK